MDAAGAVDAQNAPTAPWKTAQTAVSHSAHTHHRLLGGQKTSAATLTRLTHRKPDTPQRASPGPAPGCRETSASAFCRRTSEVDAAVGDCGRRQTCRLRRLQLRRALPTDGDPIELVEEGCSEAFADAVGLRMRRPCAGRLKAVHGQGTLTRTGRLGDVQLREAARATSAASIASGTRVRRVGLQGADLSQAV
jgi:hypothetical protein